MDLREVARLRDVMSNALTLGLGQDEARVRGALDENRNPQVTAEDYLRAVAARLEVDHGQLERITNDFHHVNCEHEHAHRDFARNVLVHVVLHELGHALVREFDLPVLSNEESLADAFATHYLVRHLPEHAPAVLTARIESLLLEANAEPREEWTVAGEHNSDARRAHQIAALALGSDPERYAALAARVGMTDGQQRAAADYGAEVHRSWRRILAPLSMPVGQRSREVRVRMIPEAEITTLLEGTEHLRVLEEALHRYDWHSQVTLALEDDHGGRASWSRSKRTISVHSSYANRFIIQSMSRSLLDL